MADHAAIAHVREQQRNWISAINAISADHVDSALRALVGNSAATALPMNGSARSRARDMGPKFNEPALGLARPRVDGPLHRA